MNRIPLLASQPNMSPSSGVTKNDPTDNSPLSASRTPIIRTRWRPLERANANEMMTLRPIRKSPFISPSSSSTIQSLLDNQRCGSTVGAFHSSNPLQFPSTLNSPRLNDSVGSVEEIREKLIHANLLAERANNLLKARRSSVRYRVSLQVPIHCLNQAKREYRQLQCEPVVELHRAGVRERALSLARMQLNLKELESNLVVHEESSISVSPASNLANESRIFTTKQSDFRTPNGDLVLIGVSNLHLRCLLFISQFSYQTPILSPQGEVLGRINIDLSTAIRSEDSRLQHLGDSVEVLHREPSDFEGSSVLEVRVAIREAIGIPNSFTRTILCHYQMLGVDEPIVVLPKLESFSVQSPPDPTNKEYDFAQRCVFDHNRTFQLPLTRRTLSSLADYVLSIEVYGNLQDWKTSANLRRVTSIRTQLSQNSTKQLTDQQLEEFQRITNPPLARTTKLRRYKSDIADRQRPMLPDSQTLANTASPANGIVNKVTSRMAEEWLKVQRRLDFWVAIEELMEDGNFKKVSVIPFADVKTGGIYQLRQGLNRRIRVLIRPNDLSRKEKGILPLVCATVSKVSIGCATRSFADMDAGSSQKAKGHPVLDSYQEYDLEMLRYKWCNAMDEWQSYLQHNLQVLARKREKDAADEAKEGYLLNRWVSSIQERDAILVPSPGCSLPGAPATELPSSGIEQHNPIVFADIRDRTFEKPLKVGSHSYLEGEEASLREGKSFVRLPIIKTYATLIGALASWDSNLHETDLLNKITPPSERIYLIVKVNIPVNKPALMTLVLRKRICVKIVKRNAISNIFRSPFSRMVYNEKEDLLWTGVAYQFVAGIPQMAPYLANPTTADVKKEETVSAETFSKQYLQTIQSVSSKLYLDGLRQEVALREALATNQHLRQPFHIANLDLAMPESTSEEITVSRSRSFNNQSKQPTQSHILRQRSQTRQRPILYPNLSKILAGTGSPLLSPLFFEGQGEVHRIKSSAVGETEEGDFCASTPSTVINPPASEEQMAWSRREREKQGYAN